MRKPYRSPWVTPLIAAAAAVLGSAAPGRAWIDTGHKVVAFVAWEDLTPKTRAAVTADLKAHHRYTEDLLSGGSLEPVPAGVTAGMTPPELDRRAFVAAAVWPDLIKSPGHPMRIRYGHSNWHFIDLPFVEPATQPSGGPTSAPAADVDTGNAKRRTQAVGPHDIIEALHLVTTELRDPATPPEERAVDVCWVNHLVGDIHQPLHCCSLFSATYPHGDGGGNDEVVMEDVRYQNTKHNLHFIWDALPGDFASDDLDRFEAQGLRADPAYARSTYPQLGTTDVMAWAKESRQLAVDDAYLDGKLKAAVGSFGDRVPYGTAIPGLPAGYKRTAEHVAMRQVTLAGYRLADLLNSIYDPAGGGH